MAMLSGMVRTTAVRWRERVLTEAHTITASDHGWRLIAAGVEVTLSPPETLGESFECQVVGRNEISPLGPTDIPDDGYGHHYWVQRGVYPATDDWPESRVNDLLHFRVMDGRLTVEKHSPTEPFVFAP